MTKRSFLVLFIRLFIGCVLAFSAGAAQQQNVTFSLSQETAMGASVFVLGDVAELGGDNPIYAVKLEPYDYPVWQLTVALPAGITYHYRYATRLDAPEQLPDAGNITYLTDSQAGQTAPPTTPTPTVGKTAHYHSGWQRAFVVYEEGSQNQEAEMTISGPGRTPTEHHFVAENLGTWDQPLAFYFHNESGDVDKPPDADAYVTSLNGFFVQDGEVFNYVPPAAPSAPRIELHENFHSNVLNNSRTIRVLLPRGYDENSLKSYPVLYMHDGQNIFIPGGPFGCWYLDDTSERYTAMGLLRETLIVGVDNMGEDRMREYNPPCSGGIADQYAQFLITELKPFIDNTYRTLPDAANTMTSGSSMGGLVSAYLAWEFAGTFGAAAGLSSSFVEFPELITSFETEAKPAVKLYLDSGSGGDSYDGLWGTWNARDALLHGGFALDRDLEHFIYYGAIHNEAAWAARVQVPLLFMLPVTVEPNPLDPGTAATPTPQATPTSQATPTPAVTLTPTGTPALDQGMELLMDDRDLVAGDRLYLHFYLRNQLTHAISVDAYVVLKVFDTYWFWPSWRELGEGVDFRTISVSASSSRHEVALDFTWPAGVGAASDVGFLGVACAAQSYTILGELQEIQWSYE